MDHTSHNLRHSPLNFLSPESSHGLFRVFPAAPQFHMRRFLALNCSYLVCDLSGETCCIQPAFRLISVPSGRDDTSSDKRDRLLTFDTLSPHWKTGRIHRKSGDKVPLSIDYTPVTRKRRPPKCGNLFLRYVREKRPSDPDAVLVLTRTDSC